LKPPKYKPEYCKKLIEHMSTGLSFESFGGKVSVGRTTLYDWVKAYPEFSKAKDIAFDKCQLWWEEAGLKGMFMGGKDNPFQGQVWAFNMAARFKWSNHNKTEVTHNVSLEGLVDDSHSKDIIEGEIVTKEITDGK